MTAAALTLGSVVLYAAASLRALWLVHLCRDRREIALLGAALGVLAPARAASLLSATTHGPVALAAVEFSAAALLLAALVRLPDALRRTVGAGASEGRVRFLMERGDDAVFLLDAAASVLLEANAHMVELTGRARDHLVGRSPLEFGPELTPAFLDGLLQPLREGRVPWVRAETPLRWSDGSTRPVGLHVQWGTWGSREVMVVVAVDVASRKAAEEEAQASRRRLEEAQRAARLGTWVWELESDTLTWCDELFRIFGREPGSFQPRFDVVLEHMHPDDRERVRRTVATARRRGEGFETEYRLPGENGDLRWVHVSARMDHDVEGRPLRLRGISQDITALRSAEAALATSAARYRRLFEQAPVSLWEEDVSGALVRLEELRAAGVDDLAAYLDGHPEELDALFHRVRVLDANPAAVELHGAACREDLLGPLPAPATRENREGFRDILVALFEGRSRHQVVGDGPPGGAAKQVLVTMSLPVTEEDRGIALVSLVDLTARMEVERALRDREAELSRALGAARMGIWRWDMRDGRVVWTEEVYRIFGEAAEGFDGSVESYMGLLHPEDREVIQTDIAEAIASGGDYTTEVRLRPDARGEIRWMAGAGRVEFGDDGEPVALHGLVWEVTEQRRAEAALRETESRLAWVVDNAPVVVFALDSEGRFILSKGRALAGLGLAPDEVVGASAFDLYRDEPAVTDAVRRAMRGEEVVSTVRLGATVFEVRYHPSRKEGTGAFGVIGIATDITGMVEAEAEQAKLAAVVEGTEKFIGLATADGTPTYLNPAALQLLGVKGMEELSGLRVRAFLAHPEEYDRVLRPALRTHGRWRGEVALRRFDTGASIPCFANIFLIHDADGRPMAVAAVLRDLREEQEAAQERERMERQLRQAQKMETIGTLAGGIAHDFNNLLTPILGYAQLMREELDPDGAMAQDLGEIVHAASRAKDLVHQILSFSRHKEQDRQPVDVAPVLREATRLLRGTLPSAIEVRLQVEDGCRWVEGDATQIHQVILNLATNSLHAMKDRNGVLGLELAEVEVDEILALAHPNLTPGPHVRITVSDTGHGMSPQVMERVLEPFFTTKASGEGTGLGLSVVHGIVTGHGGALALYSEPGAGTTVNVYLPVAEHRRGALAPELERPAGKRARRVLVVDDREDIALLVRRMLTSMGHQAEAVFTSAEALERITLVPHHFDVLVTDYSMPGMSGIELVRRVRELRPDLPVVMASGFSETLTPELLAAEGVSAFLMKPFAARELDRAMERAAEE